MVLIGIHKFQQHRYGDIYVDSRKLIDFLLLLVEGLSVFVHL